MCGRFTLTTPTDEISEYFRILEGGAGFARHRHRPRYNIAPTQEVACVRRRVSPEEQGAATRELVEMRWGLIPSWAKEKKIGARTINARSETAADKPMFRSSFTKRRCLIPIDGFYEWERKQSGKLPHYIRSADGEPLPVAGLWSIWNDPETDERLLTCTILTGSPNMLLEKIHDRMPIIMPPDRWDAWLDPTLTDKETVKNLMSVYPAERMDEYAVSTLVNKVQNNSIDLIKPLETPIVESL